MIRFINIVRSILLVFIFHPNDTVVNSFTITTTHSAIAKAFLASSSLLQQRQQPPFCSLPKASTASIGGSRYCIDNNQKYDSSVIKTFLYAVSSSDNNNRRQADDNDNRAVAESISYYYLATCIPGLGNVLANELIQLHCDDVVIQSSSAVTFSTTNIQTILNVLVWTRTAHKILELLCSNNHSNQVHITNRDELYAFVRSNMDVKDLLGNGRGGLLSLAVSVTCNNARYIPSDINHSHYTALMIKNALVDSVRDIRSDRPNVDLMDPDVPIHAIILGINKENNNFNKQGQRNYNTNKFDDNNDISSSGGAYVSIYRQIHSIGSLHRRGYRSDENMPIHKAAMKESLAAGLLLQSQWDQKCRTILSDHDNEQSYIVDQIGESNDKSIVLMDPMAGSGTFLIEGAMMACDIAPGLMRMKCNVIGSRTPPIVRWKHPPSFLANDARTGSSDSVEDIWKHVLMDATKRAKDGLKKLATDDPTKRKVNIVGNDIYPNAIQLADDALKMAGLRHIVDLSSIDCKEWKPQQLLMKPSHPGADNEANNHNDNTSWMVVCNPPWGIRLGGDDEVYVRDAWESLRVFLRQTCSPGATTAFILSGNKDRTKHLGLQRSSSLPIKIGEQDLRYLEYVIRNKNYDNYSNDNINNSNNYSDDDDGDSSQQTETRRPKPYVTRTVGAIGLNDRPRSDRNDTSNGSLADKYNSGVQPSYGTTRTRKSDRLSSSSYRGGGDRFNSMDNRGFRDPSTRPSYLNGSRNQKQDERRGGGRKTQQKRQKAVTSPGKNNDEDNEWLI